MNCVPLLPYSYFPLSTNCPRNGEPLRQFEIRRVAATEAHSSHCDSASPTVSRLNFEPPPTHNERDPDPIFPLPVSAALQNLVALIRMRWSVCLYSITLRVRLRELQSGGLCKKSLPKMRTEVGTVGSTKVGMACCASTLPPHTHFIR